MSVTDRRAELEDLETRERIRVPLDALQEPPTGDDDLAGA
jgi:hypothetical protein